MKEPIRDLDSAELLELVRTGGLDDLEILEVVRSPFCTAQVAELVASRRENLGTQAVRENLAGFPGLSIAQALNLVGTLAWTSLVAVSQHPRTPPPVRRQAERKLILMVPSMTLGEKVALARRAHRALFPALTSAGDEKILEALLDNPRLVENDIVVLVNTGRPPVDVLTAIARHRRWGRSHAIRRAIVECPRSPLPLALSVLVQLPRRDQRHIAERVDVPERVRTAADALSTRERSTGAVGPGS
ncbi:MAG: hypothetical protein MUC56_02135 [Thermoanaerobaculales bacterium]|nr:hypothetical protein [Thermoanaerobaculales bacterium]